MFNIDTLIINFDKFLKTVSNSYASNNSYMSYNSTESMVDDNLNPNQKKHSAALMRVNHAGEVCAQALYNGQQLAARQPKIKAFLQQAEQEEVMHLVICYKRIKELDSYSSYLNPFWYCASFSIGFFVASINDKFSLSFVNETEKQVSKHLSKHLKLINLQDIKSIAIIEQMLIDEQQHANQALNLGGYDLPEPCKHLMRATAKVMTSISYYI